MGMRRDVRSVSGLGGYFVLGTIYRKGVRDVVMYPSF